MTRRQVGLTAAVILGLAIVAWLAFSPYLALRSIGQAVKDRDATALNAHIDYDALRADLKAQMAQEAAKASSGPNANPAASAIGIAFMDRMVDAFVQPDMLIGLLSRKPAGTAQTQGPGIDESDIRVKRLSLTSFEAVEGDKPGGFTFRLEGLTWRLVGLDIPQRPAA